MQARYGWGELMGMSRSIEDDIKEAEHVDDHMLRMTAESLFTPGNLNIVAVGPWKSADRKEANSILKSYKTDFRP
jgi:hypothetical protein